MQVMIVMTVSLTKSDIMVTHEQKEQPKCEFATDGRCQLYTELVHEDFSFFYKTTRLLGCFDEQECKTCSVYDLIKEIDTYKAAEKDGLKDKLEDMQDAYYQENELY